MPSFMLNRLSAKERCKAEMLHEIETIADAMALPAGILEAAQGLYTAAEAKDMPMRGAAQKKSMAATMLVIACRQRQLSRTFREFEAVAGLTQKSLGQSFFRLTKALKLTVFPARAVQFVSRFCSRLGLSAQIEAAVFRAAQKVRENDLALDKSPAAVVAAIIHLIGDKSLDDISQVSLTSVNVIKSTVNALFKRRAMLFDDEQHQE